MNWLEPDRTRKNLIGVHPDLVRVVKRAQIISPIPFVIIWGLRTVAQQRAMVAAGASRTMDSRHLTGHAVDVCPTIDLDRDGKVETSEMFSWPLTREIAKIFKNAAALENVPIEWGGDWPKFRDGPHWQLPRKSYPA